MPNYRSWFPSKYVAADDLQGAVVPVVIERITQEEMPNGDGEMKPVLYFRGGTKGMVLNKTNAKRIASMFGEDTDGWIGKEILLYPSETDLRGETVPCIRVKMVDQVRQNAGILPGAAQPGGDATNGSGAELGEHEPSGPVVPF